MKFQRRGRLGTKIEFKCHQCRNTCMPKEGDWHDLQGGQVFLCRHCEQLATRGAVMDRPKLLAARVLPVRA